MHKILIAAGGTGGHLFPAQTLARTLLEKGKYVVYFAGGKLEGNPCFHPELFSFQEIPCGAIATKNPIKFIKGCLRIREGMQKTVDLIEDFKPDLVVGFGSFYTLPVLASALCKKIKIVLFEADSIPGKANRFFSRFAHLAAIQFREAESRLSCPAVVVEPMIWAKKEKKYSKKEARAFYGLEENKAVVLVFGGSQGAMMLNEIVPKALCELGNQYQVIHLTGNESKTEELQSFYRQYGLNASVKTFENQMDIAYQAADFIIARSGASTLAEKIHFELPGILIPYPFAADQHQMKNALWMQETVQGGICLPQHQMDIATLKTLIEKLRTNHLVMKENIGNFKKSQVKKEFATLIEEVLK